MSERTWVSRWGRDLLLTLPVPGDVLGVNQLNGRHWGVRKKAMDPWKHGAWAVGVHALAQPGIVVPDPATVRVYVPVPDARKRDPHNYVGTIVKALVDGLVQANWWADDDPTHLSVMEPVLIPPGFHCTASQGDVKLAISSKVVTIRVMPREGE